MVIFLLAETRASAAVKELEELRSPSPSHLSSSDVASEASKAARSVAMKEAAMGSAVQAGARWRYAKILQEVVGPMEERLDELFDFEPLISRRGNLILVPPVVTEAGEGLRMGPPSTASGDNGSAGSRSAVGQSKSYQMIRSAYLSALAPHWRHYLMDLPDGPGGFHPSLLPEGSLETSQWRSWVDQGWELGVRHAERLFEQKSSQLARDYSGMLLFKRLVYLNLAVGPQAKENKIDLEILGREMIFDRKYFQLIEEGRFAEPKGRALPR
jgi:defect-in-organelle-trafficking protein DotC